MTNDCVSLPTMTWSPLMADREQLPDNPNFLAEPRSHLQLSKWLS